MSYRGGQLFAHAGISSIAALGILALSNIFNPAAADGPDAFDYAEPFATNIVSLDPDGPITGAPPPKREFHITQHVRKESARERDFNAAVKCATPLMKEKNLTLDSVIAEFEGEKITLRTAFNDWMVNCTPPAKYFEKWTQCFSIYGFGRMTGDYSFVEVKYDLPGNDDVNKIAHKESRFYPCAVSRAKAMGMTQFMDFTGELEGLNNPFDPIEAVHATGRHVKRLYEVFPGKAGFVHAAYNWGAKNVQNHLRKFPGGCHRALNPETRGYTAGMIGNEGCRKIKVAKKKTQKRYFARVKKHRMAHVVN